MDDSWNAIRTGAFLHRDYTSEYGYYNESWGDCSTFHFVWDFWRIHSGMDNNKGCLLHHIWIDKDVVQYCHIEIMGHSITLLVGSPL